MWFHPKSAREELVMHRTKRGWAVGGLVVAYQAEQYEHVE